MSHSLMRGVYKLVAVLHTLHHFNICHDKWSVLFKHVVVEVFLHSGRPPPEDHATMQMPVPKPEP